MEGRDFTSMSDPHDIDARVREDQEGDIRIQHNNKRKRKGEKQYHLPCMNSLLGDPP